MNVLHAVDRGDTAYIVRSLDGHGEALVISTPVTRRAEIEAKLRVLRRG